MKMKKKLFIAVSLMYSASYAFAQFNLDKGELNKLEQEGKQDIKNEDVNKSKNDAKEEMNRLLNSNKKPLTNDEVINGLKEALKVGTNNSAAASSKTDGFYQNPKIKIPFPEDAQKVKDRMISLGMQSQVDKFELTLNRAAEEAAKDAAPIFTKAITDMSIGDGFSILKGQNNAATKYLQDKTTSDLYQKFKPTVNNATQKVELTKAWNPIISVYNELPGVEQVNPDLNDFVTKKAMEGLFKLIADEELKIRQDPTARVSDILKRVFDNTGK
jgi:hypothetical protein